MTQPALRLILSKETPSRGLFIAFLGPDGSGKTSLSSHLTEWWKERYGTQVQYVHLNFNLIPRLKGLRIFLNRAVGRTPKPDVDTTAHHSDLQIKPHPLVRSLLLISYYFIDFALGHSVVNRRRRQRELLIADRYFYDYFYQKINSRLPFWLLTAMMKWVPKPDLVFFLERDAEKIHSQKSELTVGEIRRQQSILRQILPYLPNAQVLDAGEGLQATCAQIEMRVSELLAMQSKEHP